MAVDLSELRQVVTQGALSVVEMAAPMLVDSLTGFVWDWQSGGDRDEFPEHVALNGAFGATIAAFGDFSPGDHHGCRCRLVDVRETAQIVGVTGGGSSAVVTVEFGVGFDSEPLVMSLSAGGVTVTTSVPSDAGDWEALILQLEQRWPEACQRALDSGALSG